MKELKEFTVERLEAIIELSENPTMSALAKIALAAKRVEPVGYFIKMPNDSYYQLSKSDEAMDGDTLLYTTPPLNHTEHHLDIVVPDDVRNALELALEAMQFMGDTLNNLDAVCAEDVEHVTPAFEAIRKLLAAPPKPEM